MKKYFLTMCFMVVAMVLSAAESTWLTDLPKAQELAKKDGKVVLLDFTGSDWCGWCKKLHKEVFSTSEFTEYASKNLVLVEVDFPARKPQSDALKKANDALQKKYGIQGYPTLVILDAQGEKLGEMGYVPGGPKPFLAQLSKITKKK